MTRTVATKLAEARKLIERGWTQGHYARGKSGRVTSPCGRYAVCFCAAGAIGAVNHDWPGSYLDGMQELSLAIDGDGFETAILEWNDAPERTQADVIEAFKRAEQLAGAE